jgi:predicted GIY-YIG superfamily endonuclease
MAKGLEMYSVYHISANNDLRMGYIGVSIDVERRWKEHNRDDFTVGREIRKQGWTFDILKIIYEGTKQECYDLERRLRPTKNIGLNEASGGEGGIGRSMKGIPKTKEHRKALSESRMGRFTGEENAYAKTWCVIDPEGKEYTIKGRFQGFCDEHNITRSALRKHIGERVPPTNSKYREVSEELTARRNNTIGWRLL